MALNLSKASEISHIPSRVRGDVTDADREAIWKEFFQLIDLAKDSATGAFGPASVEGASECNRYASALQAMKTAHPSNWACLNTAGNEYDDRGKMVKMNIYAAARPQERKMAKLGK